MNKWLTLLLNSNTWFYPNLERINLSIISWNLSSRYQWKLCYLKSKKATNVLFIQCKLLYLPQAKEENIYICIYIYIWIYGRLKTWKKSSTPTSTARKEISSVIGRFNELQTRKGGEGRKKCALNLRHCKTEKTYLLFKYKLSKDLA